MYFKNDFGAKRREAFNIYIKYYEAKERLVSPPWGATKKSFDFFVGGKPLVKFINLVYNSVDYFFHISFFHFCPISVKQITLMTCVWEG